MILMSLRWGRTHSSNIKKSAMIKAEGISSIYYTYANYEFIKKYEDEKIYIINVTSGDCFAN